MKAIRLLAATLAAFTCAAGAQNLKPGLWDVHNRMSGSAQMDQQMAEMQKQMAAMPPDQRKMMEDAMAKQGIKLGTGGPGGMSIKMCMTREMVEKNEFPAQQGDCKTTSQSRSGNTMKFSVACANPPSTGEGQMVFTSPEAYSMKMAITSQIQGKPEKITMDGGGKWLGADCGNVKPIVIPTAKK